MDVKIFCRKGAEKDERHKAIEAGQRARLEKNLADEIRILTDERLKRLAGLLGGEFRQNLDAGLILLTISLVLFFVFGSLFGAWRNLGPYWPVLIILFGVILLVRALLRPRHG